MKKIFLLFVTSLLLLTTFVAADSYYSSSDNSYTSTSMNMDMRYSQDDNYYAPTTNADRFYGDELHTSCADCRTYRVLPLSERPIDVYHVQNDYAPTCGSCVTVRDMPVVHSVPDVSYSIYPTSPCALNAYSYYNY